MFMDMPTTTIGRKYRCVEILLFQWTYAIVITDEGAYNNLATSNERQSKMRRIFFSRLGAGAKEKGAYLEIRN